MVRWLPTIWWGLFFTGVVAAWGMLLALQAEPGNLPRVGDPAFWRVLCAPDASYPALALMWGLMGLAMMTPSAIPFFKTYHDLIHARAGSHAGLSALVLGYVIVWLGFAAIAAGLQQALALAGWIDPLGRSTLRTFDVALLAAAGFYQLSALKAACLSRCRTPLMQFIADWRPGGLGAFQMGARHGLVCLGCCWALMLLAFVGGTMNLAWMGMAMVLMTLEKLSEVGRLMTRPLAAALLVAAGARAGGLW